MPDTIKVKQEKIDDKPDKPESEISNDRVTTTPPPVSKRLDDDAEALEVPKLLGLYILIEKFVLRSTIHKIIYKNLDEKYQLIICIFFFSEKTKNPTVCKIQIKDLKNSEVYNNTVKEVENQIKQKAERMEDGEISDSDDENRTPSLSPTPPLEGDRSRVGGLRSDRSRHSKSPSSHGTRKNDLRNLLKEREKKKHVGSSRSSSKSNAKDKKSRHRSRDKDRSSSCHSRDKRSRSRSGKYLQ